MDAPEADAGLLKRSHYQLKELWAAHVLHSALASGCLFGSQRNPTRVIATNGIKRVASIAS